MSGYFDSDIGKITQSGGSFSTVQPDTGISTDPHSRYIEVDYNQRAPTGSGGGGGGSFVDNFSVNFNGATQFITFGNHLAYEYTQSWTISCWIKAAALNQNFKTIIGKIQASGYRGYELQIKNQTIECDIANSGTVYIEVGTTANVITSTATWYHVAWTNSGSGTGAGQKIYINGSSVAVSIIHDNLAGNTIINTNNFGPGNRSDASANFSGGIDDISFFDTALSAGQITTLYNSGKPGDLTGMANLQLWSWMGDGDDATALNGFIDHSTNSFNGTGNFITSANIVSDHP